MKFHENQYVQALRAGIFSDNQRIKIVDAAVDVVFGPRYSRSTEFGRQFHFAVAPDSPSSGQVSASRSPHPLKINRLQAMWWGPVPAHPAQQPSGPCVRRAGCR
jgi:hypothetical protein